MRKGFTIIELLVASLLLGMLVTILTMIFNQSSIAWRTGVAGVADLDDVRDTIAEVREEADNAFIWDNQVYRIMGLWDETGNFRQRACDASGSGVQNNERATLLRTYLPASGTVRPRDLKAINVGSGQGARSFKTYTVNVMSAGPDKEFETWDDIWSWPDDFE